MEHLSIGETAKLLGVSVSTLRRWEVEKTLLPAYRTVGGHRRYLWQDIQHFCGQFAPELRKTIAYARVSSHDPKDDLERQAQRLEQYCTEHGFDNVTVLKDLGRGLNYHKKQFKQLLRMIALSKNLKKLKRLSQALSRKVKDSHNRYKAKLQLSTLHQRIKNIRQDALHKLSYYLTTRFNTVFIQAQNCVRCVVLSMNA